MPVSAAHRRAALQCHVPQQIPSSSTSSNAPTATSTSAALLTPKQGSLGTTKAEAHCGQAAAVRSSWSTARPGRGGRGPSARRATLFRPSGPPGLHVSCWSATGLRPWLQPVVPPGLADPRIFGHARRRRGGYAASAFTSAWQSGGGGPAIPVTVASAQTAILLRQRQLGGSRQWCSSPRRC
jgi:hypothetical protein